MILLSVVSLPFSETLLTNSLVGSSLKEMTVSSPTVNSQQFLQTAWGSHGYLPYI